MNLQSCTEKVTKKQFGQALQMIQRFVNEPEQFIAVYEMTSEERRCVIRQDVCSILAGLRQQYWFVDKFAYGWWNAEAKEAYCLLRNFVQTLIHQHVFVIDQFSLLEWAQLLCPSIGDENNCLLNRIRARLTTPEGKKEFEASKSAIIHALDALYNQVEGPLRDRTWIVLDTSPWTSQDREDLKFETMSKWI